MVTITVSARDALGAAATGTVTATQSAGTVPVLTPVNFSIPTATGLDVLIGTIIGTNTPTTYTIVNGDSNQDFAAYAATQHLRTSATIGPAPDNIYHLMVSGSNASGTGAAVAVNVTVGAIPVVSAASFALTLPVTAGEIVGTMFTTKGTPTSWAFASGNTSGYFAISNTGVVSITVAGVAGLTAATYNLTCTATNALGTSSSMSVVIVLQQQGTGGFNNLIAIPSAANRPVFNSGNNILSWIGPVGGGPSTANDTAQTLVLTNSGTITTTSPGQVVSGFNVSGQIVVAHNNVTVKTCHIKNNTVNDNSGTQSAAQIWVGTGITGTVIEDCECDGNYTNAVAPSGSGSIMGAPNPTVQNATIRRCNLHTSEQMLRYKINNILFIDNWCNNAIGPDCDMVECYPVGTDNNNLTIQHNCFDGTVQSGLNSGINFTNGFSGAAGNIGPNVSVTNNYFLNSGNTFCICDDNSQGTGTVSWNATNNGFYITTGLIYRRDSTTIVTNSGNFNMATPTSISGTLTGGTGQI